MSQPEVPEKYREIKPGAVVEHVAPGGEVESTVTVSESPFFIEWAIGGPGEWNWDGWLYEVEGDDCYQYLCSAARVIQPAPEAPPSAESRLAEIAGLVREFKDRLENSLFRIHFDPEVKQLLDRIEQLTKEKESE